MTNHEICETARHTACVCGAAPDHDCTCPGHGVHVSRCIRARKLDWLTQDDIAYVIRNFLTVVPDPGEV